MLALLKGCLLCVSMFPKTDNTSNSLRKWLLFLYVFSTLVVMLLIFYLESSGQTDGSVIIRPMELMDASGGEDRPLLDLKHFRYIINNRVCGERNKKKIFAVVIVTSYAGDVEMRNTIRRTYPAKVLAKFGVRRVFLLALIDDKNVSQEMIRDESDKFNDILQGNFYEGYRNLTYKHIMGLQWVTEYCSQAKYIIKMDHDIVFDFYRLNFLVKKLPPDNLLLAGYIMSHMKPMRDPTNKWYVTNGEYSRSNYPNFLSGWLYITNPQTAKLLCNLSRDLPYFWIDDLYVTGLLVERTNISFSRLNKYYTTHPEYLQCCIDKPNLICDYLIGPVGHDNRLMIQFQKYSEHCFYKICKKRSEANSLKSTCIAKWKDEPFGKGRAVVDLISLS